MEKCKLSDWATPLYGEPVVSSYLPVYTVHTADTAVSTDSVAGSHCIYISS
jgi:hypothetical protein